MTGTTRIDLFKEDMKFSAGHFTIFSARLRLTPLSDVNVLASAVLMLTLSVPAVGVTRAVSAEAIGGATSGFSTRTERTRNAGFASAPMPMC